MKTLVGGLLLSALALTACNTNFNRDPVVVVKSDGAQKLSAPTWATVSAEVFEPKCLSCHRPGGKSNDLTTYEKVITSLDQINSRAVVLKTMPKKPDFLSDEQVDLLRRWIAAGAPETDTPAQKPIETPVADVDWEELRTKVIEPRCLSCHKAGNADGLSDYTTYEQVRGTISTIVFASLVTDSMPPRPEGVAPEDPNPAALTKEQKTLISRWIIDGFKLKNETKP
jgi:mono/diheme cytochrome c family protein